MRRVAIRLIDRQRGRTVRVGAYGAPLTNLPNEMSVESAPFVDEISRAPRALVEDLTDRNLPETASTPITSLLVAPIRIDDRSVGVIVADRSGEPFGLTQGELDLAQAMANVAALAVASAAAHPFANAAYHDARAGMGGLLPIAAVLPAHATPWRCPAGGRGDSRANVSISRKRTLRIALERWH
jgi:hypothetical protein